MDKRLIYLDNAATSFPKPPEVYSEMVRAMMQYGGNPGRGSHKLSMEAAKKIYECRTLAARLFGVDDPERVFFTMNATHGLNTVIKGLLKKGDHVLISDIEHNAVYRPVYKLAKEGKIDFSIFRSRPKNGNVCSDIASKMRRNTRMIVCNHCSNICSLTLPIKEIADFCKRSGVLFVVDASQSAGHEKIQVDKMGIDALCAPGHKGLYGTQGSGVVVLGRGIVLDTLTEGGNGVNSLEGAMPSFSPERYEAGTLSTPSIAGLCEGIRAVEEIGTERISQHEKKLYRMAREELSKIGGIRIYLPEYEGAVMSFNIEGQSVEKVGKRLDDRNICVRSGYHCSSLGHRSIGSEKTGSVRVSFGLFNNEWEIEELARAIHEIVKEG